MYENWDTCVPRKHHADYRDRGNWGTSKTRNVKRVVYRFNYIIMKVLHKNIACAHMRAFSNIFI